MFSVVRSSMYYPYILCFVFLYWVSVAWQAFERKMEKEVGRVTVADPGQRPGEWGRPPLILRPNWGPRAENKIFADRAPPPTPPLSQGLDRALYENAKHERCLPSSLAPSSRSSGPVFFPSLSNVCCQYENMFPLFCKLVANSLGASVGCWQESVGYVYISGIRRVECIPWEVKGSIHRTPRHVSTPDVFLRKITSVRKVPPASGLSFLSYSISLRRWSKMADAFGISLLSMSVLSWAEALF